MTSEQLGLGRDGGDSSVGEEEKSQTVFIFCASTVLTVCSLPFFALKQQEKNRGVTGPANLVAKTATGVTVAAIMPASSSHGGRCGRRNDKKEG